MIAVGAPKDHGHVRKLGLPATWIDSFTLFRLSGDRRNEEGAEDVRNWYTSVVNYGKELQWDLYDDRLYQRATYSLIGRAKRVFDQKYADRPENVVALSKFLRKKLGPHDAVTLYTRRITEIKQGEKEEVPAFNDRFLRIYYALEEVSGETMNAEAWTTKFHRAALKGHIGQILDTIHRKPFKSLEKSFSWALRAEIVWKRGNRSGTDPVMQPAGTGATFLTPSAHQAEGNFLAKKVSSSEEERLRAQVHNMQLRERNLTKQVTNLQNQLSLRSPEKTNVTQVTMKTARQPPNTSGWQPKSAQQRSGVNSLQNDRKLTQRFRKPSKNQFCLYCGSVEHTYGYCDQVRGSCFWCLDSSHMVKDCDKRARGEISWRAKVRRAGATCYLTMPRGAQSSIDGATQDIRTTSVGTHPSKPQQEFTALAAVEALLLSAEEDSRLASIQEEARKQDSGVYAILGTSFKTSQRADVNGVLDTASSKSMVSRLHYEHLHRLGDAMISGVTEKTPVVANGQRLKSTQLAKVVFWVQDQRITFEFYVVDDLAVDLLCGLNFILYSKMDLSPYRRCAWMERYQKAIALNIDPEKYRCQLPMTPLVTKEAVVFPPGHERFLRVDAQNRSSLPGKHNVDGLALADAVSEMKSNLRLAESVVNLSNGTSTVRLGNFSEEPVHVPAGTPVAQFYPGTTESRPDQACFLCLDTVPEVFDYSEEDAKAYERFKESVDLLKTEVQMPMGPKTGVSKCSTPEAAFLAPTRKKRSGLHREVVEDDGNDSLDLARAIAATPEYGIESDTEKKADKVRGKETNEPEATESPTPTEQPALTANTDESKTDGEARVVPEPVPELDDVTVEELEAKFQKLKENELKPAPVVVKEGYNLCGDLSQKEQDKLLDLFKQYGDIFATSLSDLTVSKLPYMRLDIPNDATPVSVPLRGMAQDVTDAACETVDDLSGAGKIGK